MHVTSHVSDPLPAAVGLVAIDVIEQEGLVEQARRRGEYLLARLRELQQRHVHIGDVRGKGLLVGIELSRIERQKNQPTCWGAPSVTNAQANYPYLEVSIRHHAPMTEVSRLASGL